MQRDAEGFADAAAIEAEVWRECFRPPAVSWATPHAPPLELLRAEVLAELRDAVRQVIREELAALRPQATDAAADFLVTLAASYGTGAPFFAVDVVEFVDAQPVLRAELRQALQALCKTDTTPTAQQLGLALRQLVSAPPAGFTVEATDRRGTTAWTVQDLRERVPPPPQAAPAR